jgi:hypothetical protein
MVRIPVSTEAKRHPSLPLNPSQQQQSLVQQLQQRRFQRRLKVAATQSHQLPAYSLPFKQFQHLQIEPSAEGGHIRWMAPLSVSPNYEDDLLWCNTELLAAAAAGATNNDLLASNKAAGLLLDSTGQQHMEYSMT